MRVHTSVGSKSHYTLYIGPSVPLQQAELLLEHFKRVQEDFPHVVTIERSPRMPPMDFTIFEHSLTLHRMHLSGSFTPDGSVKGHV